MKFIDNNSILSCKSEKEIQKKIQLYLESCTGVSIIEEEFQSIPTLDDKKYPHLDKWFIVNNILESFESFHKSADNADIKDAVFNYKSKFTTVEVEDKNCKRHVEKYNLMSFLFIISEKMIDINWDYKVK